MMDPFLWRTVSYVVVFLGTLLVLAGSIGTWYFGNLAEEVAPFRQMVRAASSTVELIVESPEQVNTTYMDRGGLLALVRGATPLLVTAATESTARQLGGNKVLWRGVFQMDAGDSAVGQPVSRLKEAEYVQIEFAQMAKDAHVVEGRAIVTVNNVVRLEMRVPEQHAQGSRVFVRNLADVFRDFR